jgi:ribosome-binding ATPase
VKTEKILPTTVEFVDIAGIVKGASTGRGARQQVPREHPRGRRDRPRRALLRERRHRARRRPVDPLADIEIINTELALADLDSVEKGLQRATRRPRARGQGRDPRARRRSEGARRAERGPAGARAAARRARAPDRARPAVADDEAGAVRRQRRRGRLHGQPDARRGDEARRREGAQVVAVCAAIEAEISQLEEADRGEFLQSIGLEEPGLNRVIRAAYKLLGLQTYFTVGPKEVRAWTVKVGATAPQAAGVIHTDFERGFIRAEVIAFDDYVAFKGEHGAKEAGKLRLEGKEYVVREGDVMHFRFNV